MSPFSIMIRIRTLLLNGSGDIISPTFMPKHCITKNKSEKDSLIKILHF